MPLVWGHRGASGLAPENTLEAFGLAAEQGAHGVEFDVQLSADGIPVVIHDETLDRTTNLTGPVVGRTVAELAACDAGRGNHVPTLVEVLELLRPTNLEVNIELKNSEVAYPGLEQAVVDVVAATGFTDRVWYSSFQHYSLRTLRQIVPDARVGLLYVEPLLDPWRYAERLEGAALHPYWRTLTVPGVLEACREAGVRTHPWTVDAQADLAAMAGADAVITNHPARALALYR